MINFATNEISQGDVTETITKWAVWFRTPVGGLYLTLDAAMKSLAKLEANVDPQMLIFPIPIAIGNTLYEEMSRR